MSICVSAAHRVALDSPAPRAARHLARPQSQSQVHFFEVVRLDDADTMSIDFDVVSLWEVLEEHGHVPAVPSTPCVSQLFDRFRYGGVMQRTLNRVVGDR